MKRLLKLISSPKTWWRQIKRTMDTSAPIVWFFILNVMLVWLKMFAEYHMNFNLGAEGATQQFLLFLNPIPTAIIFISIALYFRGALSYWLAIIFNLIQSVWLFANMLYYREFSDFLSMGILGSGSSTGNNLGKSIAAIIHWTDYLVFIDIIILIALVVFKQLTIDRKGVQKKFAILTTLFGVILMFVDYGIASTNRSGLLTRSFDNNYIVKYLGLNEYAVFNAVQTYNQTESRKRAKPTDLAKVKKFVATQKLPDNIQYYGTQKGKNVFMIHLESFQQFLIDYKVDGQEVTPNLNKFYHDQNTLSFDNFYNQVGQGKTSDAEMMQENSLFGLATGSAMVKYGTNNTFESLPAILGQRGYTTAAFHGDVASFWNRDNTYKSFGYDYFFSKSYYSNANKANYNIGYGMKDKIFLRDSAQYIEQLPQPFYAKLITVTNHYPYDLDKQNIDFPATKTGDNTVDGYVQTAHYLDQSFGELMTYLKKVGLYNNSVFVLYGDHYGISENHQPTIAQLLGKDKVTNYDLANFQKVPFMIHATGLKGGINHTYGGEIDMMPTLLDVLGVPDDGMTMFGQDMLSSNYKGKVVFRDGDWITPNYTKFNNQYFNTQTGEQVTESADKQLKKVAKTMSAYATKVLGYSDEVITGDLLRFDTSRSDFHAVNKKDYNYKKSAGLAALKKAQKSNPSSILAQNKGKSTLSDYVTDAPELKSDDSDK
ncbi:glycerol phosphate lipoteichoic acid synthase [Leuconostoc pseudomesenteroides]|uniref:Glycerol phosphate lipoteichoic acid synthase n=1 Tax=Leuconostoc pseudomesenteroides TaxID=33968 RepID=A0A1X0VDQ2_LEUPS|nr:LTA synthase family protein [Leuconostoc pseudomesenteroides]OQJ72228.1 glycerol phosphate lipoteichoic acid synthase [Leuconostoc pseudomesenteroides]OQJ76596.1 glycerol phosphate lipoteichoic acid synthase [Leuconostoc pseudomesenteroides]OQJ76654.1 glycerol phosphate lipoteichoic acid synthase [Leuconostoc pseudomesenteroides]ORI37204.1 glycerol phosphate lipoteichoic acid synthase [Leuconostoc pseudomesenteroides]ORI45855.1 glycerol phosphate lipoteichoic acid synthase [Leuconostoc pseu